MVNAGVQTLVADRYTGHSLGAVQGAYVQVSAEAMENAIDQVDQEGVKLKNFSITARLVVIGSEPEEEEEPVQGKKRKG